MFIVGILIHIVFLFSIFDIYFKSPVVNNVVSYQPHQEPAADRLVIFIVDGLRAESFVNHSTMIYMRSVANSNGRWGISNTRVPTESRPGHIAVIAGFYEDPSAVVKGWKENPVDFDSLFNQTLYTWCWGTYDIVNIFTKGSVDDHIFVNTFDPYDQIFSTDKNTTLLDSWVFENVKKFFNNAKEDMVINKKLHEKKIAFFLHLLATDTSGHTHKPNTEKFLTTVRFVDEGIKEIEKVIRDFYNDDGKTTFLMTSDHGMTDWGSHGAGEDYETQTPYVLWGAGVLQVKEQQLDPQTKDMYATHRYDINQADLTPLMSSILSIPVPVNSIGKLPANLLNMSLSNKAKAIYSNSRQLAAQYDKKRLEVETNALSILYKPYEAFTKKKYDEIIGFTEKLLAEEAYEKLIILSEEILHLSLSGLVYYHNYYQRPLLILVTLSFFGWIMCLLRLLLEQKINTEEDHVKNINVKTSKTFLHAVFLCLCVVQTFIVYVQSLPLQYYLYFLMPVCLWWYPLSNQLVCLQTYRILKSNKPIFIVWLEILCYITGSMALGLSFTYRWTLSIPLLGMGVWPLFSTKRRHLSIPILLWMISCLLLSTFSFMPVVGKEVFIELVIFAGIIWLMVTAVYTWKVLLPLYKGNEENRTEIILTIIQMFLLSFSLHNIYVQSKRYERSNPVSYPYQMMAWIIAFTSLILPLAHSRRIICRLSAISTSLLNFYLLLSVSHEGLFMVTLILNVTCWIYIEYRLLHLKNTKLIECYFHNENNEANMRDSLLPLERGISSHDFRRAFFFLIYIITAFFGTGNIASLNSFEVRWVTCFLTSYQPFVIMGLILLKTLSPFLCVACTFRAIHHLTKAPTGSLHTIVLIYTNLMGIQLLYYVKNTGSWLEIGTSITQFVIVQVITLFIFIINQFAKILTDINIYNFTNNIFKTRKKYV